MQGSMPHGAWTALSLLGRDRALDSHQYVFFGGHRGSRPNRSTHGVNAPRTPTGIEPTAMRRLSGRHSHAIRRPSRLTAIRLTQRAGSPQAAGVLRWLGVLGCLVMQTWSPKMTVRGASADSNSRSSAM